jgi:hypothetical protein
MIFKQIDTTESLQALVCLVAGPDRLVPQAGVAGRSDVLPGITELLQPHMHSSPISYWEP